jgi:hypothetical protein
MAPCKTRRCSGTTALRILQEQKIPAGQNEIPLRFKDAVLDKLILRKCNKAGKRLRMSPCLNPPSPASSAARSATLDTSVQPRSTPSIDSEARRVDESYTKVQLSQHLTQAARHAKPAKKLTHKTPLDERRHNSSLQRSVSVHSRAEVIIIHTPSTLDACETHAHTLEKSIASLAT